MAVNGETYFNACPLKGQKRQESGSPVFESFLKKVRGVRQPLDPSIRLSERRVQPLAKDVYLLAVSVTPLDGRA